MKRISIVTSAYNEEDNVGPLYERVRAVMDEHPQYSFELIFLDNDSTDATVERIKAIARRDPDVKLIVNSRNFGHVRSPMHGLMQARGDAVVLMASDLEEPPELIRDFIQRWEEGYRIVAAVRRSRKESWYLRWMRRLFYRSIRKIAEVRMIPNFTGFGLYDRQVVDVVRQMNDPYPYFRGMIAEIGFDVAEVLFDAPARTRGITKNNFYTLYDLAMLGITSYSKVPIRIATMAGFGLSLLSLLISLGYLVAKLVMWDTFKLGFAPLLIGLFFFASVQLFFVGLLGEYVGAVHTLVQKRPLVVERERVNFDDDPPPPSPE